MRRGALQTLVAGVLLTAAPAHAQDAPAAFLAADASKAGVITLVFFGPADGTVRFRERVRGQAVELGTVRTSRAGVAVLPDATTWRCGRRERHFEAVETTSYGKELPGSFAVRTASCRERMTLSAPGRVRRGSLVDVRMRDLWRLGGLAPRLCVAPPGSMSQCRTVRFGRGSASALRRFRADERGTWRVELRYGGRRLRRVVGVGVGAQRPGEERPVFLTTGDSTIQGIDAFLGVELADRADVRSQYFVGTGISSPFSPWPDLPARQLKRFSPDATVVSIGANEGSAMNGAECCGESWVAEYARRAGEMMRAYRRVVWLTLPIPRDERRRLRTLAVNAAVVRAAATLRGTRVVRLDELFSPGGVFREQIRFRGQTVRVRQPDGIHLTLPALSIAAGLVADALPARTER